MLAPNNPDLTVEPQAHSNTSKHQPSAEAMQQNLIDVDNSEN